MGTGHQETELRPRLRGGGHILGALVVVRRTMPCRHPRRPMPGCLAVVSTRDPALAAIRYVVYLRVTWRVGYHVLRTYRDREDRTFRDFDRLLLFVEELGYAGPVLVAREGSRSLRQYRSLQPGDRYQGSLEGPSID